jgi:5-methyltetrahydrofolate--homocysteine methyltransferase
MMENFEEIYKKIRNAIINFDVDKAKSEVLKAIGAGVPAGKLIEVMTEGMEVVGKKYEEGEYFVPELIMAGETMKETLEVLKPYIKEEPGVRLGTAVVATVAGDIHDIGKNIFVTLMTTAGFKVIDLGIDVPAEKIVKAIKESNASILGLSALLTTNLEQFPIVIDQLNKEGLRGKVKVIVGGATVTEEYAKASGVDGYAKTALAGVEICKNWIRETNKLQT